MEIKQIEISVQPLQRRRVIISAMLRATQGRERVFHKYEEAHWIPVLRLKHHSGSKSAPNFITLAYIYGYLILYLAAAQSRHITQNYIKHKRLHISWN